MILYFLHVIVKFLPCASYFLLEQKLTCHAETRTNLPFQKGLQPLFLLLFSPIHVQDLHVSSVCEKRVVTFISSDTQMVRHQMPNVFNALSAIIKAQCLLTRCLTVENLRSKEALPCFLSYQCIVKLAETADRWEKKIPQTFCFGHFLFRESAGKNISKSSSNSNEILSCCPFSSFLCLTRCPKYLMAFLSSYFQQLQL